MMIFAVVGLALASVIGVPFYRERRRAHLDRTRELAALERHELELTTGDVRQAAERVRAREWRANFDAAIADVNARFDALLADLPTTDDDPFPADYWPAPELGPAPEAVELERLADFDAAATLEIIMEQNAAPPSFTWTTDAWPVVPMQQPWSVVERVTTDRRRLRRAARRLTGVGTK
jgi:hypothetical protein